MADEKEPKGGSPEVSVALVDIPDWNKQKDGYIASGKDATLIKYFDSTLKKDQEDRTRLACEKVWKEADQEYEPHDLTFSKKKKLVEDEDEGWRGSRFIDLSNTRNWQETSVEPSFLVKVQIALSILVDRIPHSTLKPDGSQYKSITPIIKALHRRSWSYKGLSMQQLKLFAFDLARYGWALARTFPFTLKRKVKDLQEHYPMNPGKDKYQDMERIYFDDIKRKVISPWHAWLDRGARPGDPDSIGHWSWYEEFSWGEFYWLFKEFGNFNYVKPGGLYETSSKKDEAKPAGEEEDRVGVYFHESVTRDLFLIRANGVLINATPLPHDARNKRLSCWDAMWNYRNDMTRLGIGLWEIIKGDHKIYNKFRNMTVDQLVLAIYKMFFYQGTGQIADAQGRVVISPGYGKQVLDPKNISWVDVPGPGPEAWQGIQAWRDIMEEDTGIGKTISGSVDTGKTAFQAATAKEASLKRLKTPLDNIADALSQDAYISFGLYEEKYSTPEIIVLTDPKLIDEYKIEIQKQLPNSYQQLYDYQNKLNEQGEPIMNTDEQGNQVPETEFIAKLYPEFSLNLEEDEKGELVESEDERFFRTLPEALHWEGMVVVDPPSFLTPTQALDRQQAIEFSQVILPLIMQDPMGQIIRKPVMELTKAYDYKPEDWLPDEWLVPLPPAMPGGAPGQEPLFVEPGAQPQPGQTPTIPRTPQASSIIKRTENVVKKSIPLST